MLNSWIPDENYIYAFNGVGWFLSSLMFCYLITPLIIRIVKKCKEPVILLLLVIALRALYVSAYHYSGSSNWLYWISVIPIYRLFEYMAGVCLALIFIQKNGRTENTWVQLVCASVFVLALLCDCIVGGFGSLFICFEILLAGGWLLYSGAFDAFAGLKINGFLSKSIMTFFLFHQVVIKIYKYVCGTRSVNVYDNGLLHMFVMLLITLVICAVVFIVKERRHKTGSQT